MKAPPMLFHRGKHPDGTSTVAVTVYICTDADGKVWSAHDFQALEDAALAASWKGGGVRHLSHALLTETVRRETFVCALTAMTRDASFLETYQKADAETQQGMRLQLEAQVAQNLRDVIPKVVPGVAQEILEMIAQQR